MNESRPFHLLCLNATKKLSVQWLILLLLAGVLLYGFMPKHSQQETVPVDEASSNGWLFSSPREFVPAKVFQSIGNPAIVPENSTSSSKPMEPQANERPQSVEESSSDEGVENLESLKP